MSRLKIRFYLVVLEGAATSGTPSGPVLSLLGLAIALAISVP